MIDGSVWIGSDADALLICRGEDRAGCESEAVDLSVYVPLPHLRPQVLGRDWKNEIRDTGGENELK